MIDTNIKTHIIIFKDGSRINITKAQYELYRDEISIKKHNEFITINDIDTDKIIFEGRCNEIKEFKERISDESLQEKRVVCEYGTRHNLIGYPDNCDCKQIFDCLSFQLKDWLNENGYKIEYASDITKDMQRKFINRLHTN